MWTHSASTATRNGRRTHLVKKKSQQDPDMLPEYDFSDGVPGKYSESYAAACAMNADHRWKKEVMARVE